MAGVYPAITPEFRLYRDVWYQDGEEREGTIKTLQGASEAMQRRLSLGFPAWIVEVPMTDDDVPF